MARALKAENLPFIGTLDRGAGDLSRQLATALRVAIRRGDVRPGELIPSSRALARALRVARGTVVEAFEQLIAEGFLESRRGASTWVTQVSTQEGAAVLAKSAARPRTRRLPEAAATFTRIAEQFSPLASVPFAISVPTGATAPGEVWRRLGNRIRARGPAAPAGYSDAQGALPLREAIAGYVRRSRSVRCEADQVIITSGTQQGLYLVSQVLVGLDDPTWVETPRIQRSQQS